MKKKKILITAVLAVSAFANSFARDGVFKPFILNGNQEYLTLQEAIDAAPMTASTIEIRPCPEGVSEYDSGYATNVSGNVTANGAEVFTRCKSLKFIGLTDSKPVLKDFVVVLETSSATKPDYSISGLAFTGKSIIIADNMRGGFGKIEIYGCNADVTNRTAAFKTLKNNDSVGATYASGGFVQWMQRSTGTTDEFLFHNNEIIARLSYAGGNVRVFNGGMMTKKAVIRNNVFGSSEHPIESEDGWLMVSQCTAKNAEIELADNTIYHRGLVALVWLLATGVQATDINLAVHNNNICLDGAGRPRFNEDLLVYLSRNYVISGTVRVWKNYINGYCFNEVENAIGSAVTVDKQTGHTYGDGHIHGIADCSNLLVRKFGLKREDIYQKGKADNFDGTTHSNPVFEMGDAYFCDRCNEILSAITVKCTGLANGESVFFDIRNSEGQSVSTVRLSGNGSESVSRTVVGLEPGTYDVVPSHTEWSWTYNVPSSQRKAVKALDRTVSGEEFTFTFNLTKKAPIPIRNAENAKNLF